jgi:hypothetical protein
MGPRTLTLSIALLPILAAVRADPGDRLRLSWVRDEGAESCAVEEDMARGVRARLGHDPFDSGAERTVEGLVRRAGERWIVRLQVRDRAGRVLGTRQIESNAPDCTSIESAAALAIALVIDPQAALRLVTSPPPAASASVSHGAPAASASSAVPVASAAPTGSAASIWPAASASGSAFAEPPRSPPAAPDQGRTEAAEPGPRTSRASASVRAALLAGLLPRVAPGVAWSAGWRVVEPISVSAGVLWLPERRTEDGNAGFGLTAGWVGACGTHRAGPFEPFGCAHLGLGAVHAVVHRGEPVFPGDRAWSALGAQLGARLAVAGPVSIEGLGEAIVPLVRHRFRIAGQADPVFQQSAVAFGAQLGAAATIW